ncbi:hypothetical protein H4R34_002767 [Dimargaris verticillata]|uniref:Ribosome assembly protein 3 n=1 Tax=Dimargaris verticillata TaxID=2761393 RepID=A0A9W8B3C8_9FUNG|nr:hypothetical protein H4R34_002767 [Dimargaris verticillata]
MGTSKTKTSQAGSDNESMAGAVSSKHHSANSEVSHAAVTQAAVDEIQVLLSCVSQQIENSHCDSAARQTNGRISDVVDAAERIAQVDCTEARQLKQGSLQALHQLSRDMQQWLGQTANSHDTLQNTIHSTLSDPHSANTSKLALTGLWDQVHSLTNRLLLQVDAAQPWTATKNTLSSDTTNTASIDQIRKQFKTFYLAQMTSVFGDDLDILRESNHITEDRLEVLIDTLESGVLAFDEDEQRMTVESLQ